MTRPGSPSSTPPGEAPGPLLPPPPDGSVWAAPQPPRPPSFWRKPSGRILLVAIVLLVLGGIVAGAFALMRGVKGIAGSISEVRGVADAYVTALEQGDERRARELSCPSHQPGLVGQVSEGRTTAVNVRNVNGRQSAVVNADLALKSGGRQTVVLQLQPRGESWEIC